MVVTCLDRRLADMALSIAAAVSIDPAGKKEAARSRVFEQAEGSYTRGRRFFIYYLASL